MTFLERVVNQYSLAGSVLEVGSLNVNGTARIFFTGDYLGIDYQDGPDVDLVVTVNDDFYITHQEAFDTIICTEALEHDAHPWTTISDMSTALKPGGRIVLTVRGFGPDQGAVQSNPDSIRCYGLHDYPADYWRFSVAAMEIMFADAGLTVLEAGPDTDVTAPGVFIVGTK